MNHMADIQSSAAAFLRKHAGPQRALQLIAEPAAWDKETWQAMQNMGWAGILIPEHYGGLALCAGEALQIFEEFGRALPITPLFETAILAVQLLLAASEQAQAQYLPPIAHGELSATAVLPARSNSATLTRSPNGWRLGGNAACVPFGQSADLLLIVARHEPDQTYLLAMRPGTQGIQVAHQPNLDPTRPFARIQFDDIEINAHQLLAGPVPASHFARAHAIASFYLACEQTGGAAYCLDSTVEYAKLRVQFGRPIGSFQAVKHILADMMLHVEAARSAISHAAATLDHAHDITILQQATSSARIYCSDAFTYCAGNAIQLHGGIGYSWDHPAHLYFKRARASATCLGTPAQHRDLMAQHLGIHA